MLRKMTIGVLALLLSATLLGTVWSAVGQATIRDRTVVKGWFEKSNFYNQIVDVVLEKAKDSGKNSATGSLSINDPQIQAVAKQAFTPDFLKRSIEGALDGGYNWLDGSAQDLNFSIDLTGPKQQLVAGLGAYVKDRAAKLPVCAAGDVTSDFDSFNATCRPAALSAEEAGKQTEAQLLKQDFLKDPVLTANSFKVKDSNGVEQPITKDEKAEVVRSVYQRSSSLPYILMATALVVSLGIVFISSEKWKGVRRVGYVFASNSIVLTVTYILLGVGLGTATKKLATSSAETPKQNQLAADFAAAVVNNIRGVLGLYAAIFIVIGVSCYVATHTLKKRQVPGQEIAKKEVEETAETKEKTSSEALETDIPGKISNREK